MTDKTGRAAQQQQQQQTTSSGTNNSSQQQLSNNNNKQQQNAQNSNRILLSNSRYNGRVLSWHGNYGWMEPVEQINHKAISQHNGRIFVHKDDVVGTSGTTTNGGKGTNVPLKVSGMVEFLLYLDDHGLGACQVFFFYIHSNECKHLLKYICC